MAKKLENRFKDEGVDSREVVDYAGRYGYIQACDKYQTGIIAMKKLLREATGDENFGTVGKFSPLTPATGRTVAEEFFEKLEHCIKNKILVLEEKIEQQNEYIRLLELELQNYEGKQRENIEQGLIRVTEACRV